MSMGSRYEDGKRNSRQWQAYAAIGMFLAAFGAYISLS